MKIEFSHLNSKPLAIPDFERLDAAVAADLKSRCIEAAAGSNAMVIDLTSVRMIDSSGLGALVALLKQLGPSGILCLVGLQPGVRLVLEISRLDTIFKIYDTRDQVPA